MKKLKLSAFFLLGAVVFAGCSSTNNVLDPDDVAQGSHENISSLTAVIKANPRDPAGYNVRGSAYGRAGRNKEAIADFTSAISLNPNFYNAYANRALIYRNLVQPCRASRMLPPLITDADFHTPHLATGIMPLMISMQQYVLIATLPKAGQTRQWFMNIAARRRKPTLPTQRQSPLIRISSRQRKDNAVRAGDYPTSLASPFPLYYPSPLFDRSMAT